MTRLPALVTARNAVGVLLLGLFAACSGSSEPDLIITSIEVTPGTASPQVGETVQLGAAVKDQDGNVVPGQTVTWNSSATNVASVSASGLVTANALGSATISASAGGKVGNANITVIPEPIASIAVTPDDNTLLEGETVQLTTTMLDALGNIVTDRTVTFTSANPGVASVSTSGLVTAVADGITTVSASADSRSASATIRVLGPCNTALAAVIAVGQTVNGTLATTDCQLGDLTYTDGYGITVDAATNVQIDMTAAYDTYLFLLELTEEGLVQVAENDDIDPDDPDDPADPFDINSRITFNLQPGASYFILANSFDPEVTGDYVLKVQAVSAFIAPRTLRAKPGKAPIETLLKALKTGKPR